MKPAAPAAEPAIPRLDQLTSLRFFAALAVLSSHLWMLAESPDILRPLGQTVFHEGYAGVSFFFMLSGFILNYTYRRKLLQGAISKTRYLVLRVIRIYPLHAITALPFAAYALLNGGLGELPKAIANLALAQSWIPLPDFYFSLNEPSWSLSDELFFYAAFAWLAFLPARRLALGASALFAIAALTACALMIHGHASWRIDGKFGFPHWLSYINPATRLLDFLVGMLIYRCPRPRLSRRLWTAGEALALLALLAAMYAFSRLQLPEVLRGQLLYLPFMALVIYVFAQGVGAVSEGLRDWRLVRLGDASFALYMIHLPILNGAYLLFERLGEPLPLVPTPPAWPAYASAFRC